ncbi:hypothetical protein D9M69_604610 [compost metagenome]
MQCAYRVGGGLRSIAAGEQFLQGRVAAVAAYHSGHFGIQPVRGAGVAAAEREHQPPQQAAHQGIGKVVQQPVEGLLGLAQALFQGPAQQWLQVLGIVAVVVTLERGRSQIEVTQGVAEARGQAFTAFQLAA